MLSNQAPDCSTLVNDEINNDTSNLDDKNYHPHARVHIRFAQCKPGK